MNVKIAAVRVWIGLLLHSFGYGQIGCNNLRILTHPECPYDGRRSVAHVPFDVSLGGRYIVGWSGITEYSVTEATRWCPSHYAQLLGTLQGNDFCWALWLGSVATGISWDGNTVVGYSICFVDETCAFYMVLGSSQECQNDPRPTGMTLLAERAVASDVSADGRVVSGDITINNRFYGYIYDVSQGYMEIIDTGDYSNSATAISGDGNVAVGVVYMPSGQMAYRYDRRIRVVEYLGTLGGMESMALGVSEDGSVVVGQATDSLGNWRAFRWTSSTGMTDLGTLGGHTSRANDVSADGSIVVGEAEDVDGNKYAFVWSNSTGMINLNQICDPVDECVSLSTATAISPEGRYIVGTCSFSFPNLPIGYILEVDLFSCTPHNGDVNGDGCVDDADLLLVLWRLGDNCVCREDVNCDGIVDDADILIVLLNLGQGC